MVSHRRLRASLSAATILVWSQVGRSAPPRAAETCAQTLDHARDHAAAGRLRRARATYADCAESRCGRQVSLECRGAEQRLADSVPSIVPVVADGHQTPHTDVAVTMDGELLTTRLDGRSVEVDPGLHELKFTVDGKEIHRASILILEGQRNRLVTVDVANEAPESAPASPAATSEAPSLTAQPDDPPPSQGATSAGREGESTRSVLPYVVGGVGVAAVGTSLLLAHWASDDNRSLDVCSPNCSQESVDHVRRMYIAADITLGAGIVALGAATWLYFSPSDGERPKDTAAYHVDVCPVARGAMATMTGAF